MEKIRIVTEDFNTKVFWFENRLNLTENEIQSQKDNLKKSITDINIILQ